MGEIRRVAIIGGGPIGLEAALCAAVRGLDVTLYEVREVGSHVGRWGHVRMFSPFGMNASARGRQALRAVGVAVPDDAALLTGRQFVEQYLHPLSRLPQLASRVVTGARVLHVARKDTLKTELIGDPRRGERPLVLTLDSPTGSPTGEWAAEADCVLDCSGTFGQHNSFGGNGAPCLGESAATAEYGLPDVIGERRPDYAGKRVAVIGGGYSAATTIVALCELASGSRGGAILWLTRRAGGVDPSGIPAPIRRFDADPLSERDALATRANALATEDAVDWRPGVSVRRVERKGAGPIRLTMENLATGQAFVDTVDRVIANVGYRPDRSLYSELHVHECYATQGPMKLAARLLGESSADCLQQSAQGRDILRTPEPNFYILGAKSYGRNSQFLLQAGLQQIEEVVAALA